MTNKILQILDYYSSPSNANPMVDRDELAKRREAVEVAQATATAQGKKVSPNSNVIKNYKAVLPAVLPFSIFSVLIGHMLGDCCVKYNPHKDAASMSFEWGNKAYTWFVYTLLYDYVLSPPRVQTRINAKGNLVTTYCFQTVSLPCFAIFHHLFIVDRVKTVPVGLIQHLLSPQALAIWYMDDGGLTDYREGHGKGIQFNTQGFTTETVQTMVDELNAKYDLDCWMRILRNKGGKPIIVVPSRSYSKFYGLVKNYVDVSMMHKLPKASSV